MRRNGSLWLGVDKGLETVRVSRHQRALRHLGKSRSFTSSSILSDPPSPALRSVSGHYGLAAAHFGSPWPFEQSAQLFAPMVFTFGPECRAASPEYTTTELFERSQGEPHADIRLRGGHGPDPCRGIGANTAIFSIIRCGPAALAPVRINAALIGCMMNGGLGLMASAAALSNSRFLPVCAAWLWSVRRPASGHTH